MSSAKKPHSEEAWAVLVNYGGGLIDFGRGSVAMKSRRDQGRRAENLRWALTHSEGLRGTSARVVRVRITEIPPRPAKRRKR